MFVVFEGIDGAGKSTLVKAVQEELDRLNIVAISTSELGREEEWSVKGREEVVSANCKVEQYEAVLKARTAHASEVLENRDASTVVLMDRYLPTTVAYQRCEELPASTILLDHYKRLFPVPDITFFVRISPETAQKRKNNRGKLDAIDAKTLPYFRTIDSLLNSGLKTLKILFEWEFTVLDGEKSVEELKKICVDEITERIGVNRES